MSIYFVCVIDDCVPEGENLQGVSERQLTAVTILKRGVNHDIYKAVTQCMVSGESWYICLKDI